MSIITPAIGPALAGGALIGLVCGTMWLVHGRISGIAGIARLALQGPDRVWRLWFLAGLFAAGLIARLAWPHDLAPGYASLGWLQLIVAGALVGTGTALANGCTSGHGICGLSRLSSRSLVAVVTFMAVAAITASIVAALA
ncbi:MULTISPECIES: YeeE/YedE thiosulfate transporter family protein [unclassified Sphingomonas]|uniref:YeeE/YedE family protein n=1 Tax=Novosphingobium rhizosphaerae TaxID=1551649 RepID=UPI001804BAAB